MPVNAWSDEELRNLTQLEALVYRSRLLGSDRRIVNYGGGNTSIKTQGVDHAGRPVSVLWIKGSGSDLETISNDDFTPLRLDDVRLVELRAVMNDDEMVDYLRHCMLDPTAPRASIETMLHAFLPFTHVDHTHPEAALAFCCLESGEELMRECFGEEAVWVPYVRPGFALAKLAIAAQRRNPRATSMFLAKHGLVTWGATGHESYSRTISVLQRAEEFLGQHFDTERAFGGPLVETEERDRRRALAVSVLPVLRGALGRLERHRHIWTFDDSPEVLEFVGSSDLRDLANTGAACPDHMMYTKFLPLVVDHPADGGWSPLTLEDSTRAALESYESAYQLFFEENTDGVAEMSGSGPRIVLIPGLGMFVAGKDKWSACNSAALYRSAIAVMRGAGSIGRFASLSPKEAWDVEYWPLELCKLTVGSQDKEMAGRIALITGGAGAIGSATARRLLEENAHVVITDVDGERAACMAVELSRDYPGRVIGLQADAGSEADTERAVEECILEFGGLDLAVPNAGIAGAHPIDETTVEEWRRVQDVLLLGYFLTCRAAFTLFKRQQLGGVIVINSSKNGLAAGKNAIAYTTAKAAEAHMCRCLAEEGGDYGIRVNSVAPDAIIKDSGFWTKEWREERSRTYGFPVDEIEEYYRRRNALKVNVDARDVAETILWLASDRSSKTNGCVITIDGGLLATYPR